MAQQKWNIEDEWHRIQSEEPGSLKEKLEHLLRKASEERGQRPSTANGTGKDAWDETPAAESNAPYFDASLFDGGTPAECPFADDFYHGRVRIGSARDLSPETLALIARDEGFGTVAPDRILYLDLETTGLSQGSSNYAFVVGLGYFAENEFRVRQHFMKEFSEEIEILDKLEAFAERFDALVTFNGRAFDLPLIESRFVLARRRTRLSRLPHLDLLYASRQIWGARFESCALKSLEFNLLGIERHGDVPGAEIPRIYFDYLRTRNPYWISKVFHHNRLDILSMTALLTLVHDLVAGKAAGREWQEALGLAVFYERREKYEESTTLFVEAIEGGADRERRVRAIRRASELHRKAGRRDEAMALWRDGAQEDGKAALDFLHHMAIQFEHHERRLPDALALVQEALARLADLRERGRWEESLERHRVDFEKRRERLQKKLAKGTLPRE